MVALTQLNDEGSTIADDLAGDDVDAVIRRKAFDGALGAVLEPDVVKLIKAFEIAGIAAAQAAQVIHLAGMLQNIGGNNASN